ncbi:MAG: hypothetical protein ACPGLY_18640 [Rubripirellula sp.]
MDGRLLIGQLTVLRSLIPMAIRLAKFKHKKSYECVITKKAQLAEDGRHSISA